MKKLKHYDINHVDFSVSAKNIPPDNCFIGPLIGNDELKFLLDARGVMHDYTPPPAWPPPRIVWTGRRHNQRIDRYNSNLFEYGFFNIELVDENKLPKVTSWHQKLYPEDGYVKTIIEREGGISETATTFLCLDKNLIVCKRRYENLPDGINRKVRALYKFCQIGVDEIPFRTTWQPLKADNSGIAADFTADGHTIYSGQIALFALTKGAFAYAEGNALKLEVELDKNNEVTICIAMADDLGDNPQLVDIWAADWMPKGVREVYEENKHKAANYQRADYRKVIEDIRKIAFQQGFDGLLAQQSAAWHRVFANFKLSLPANEPLLNAAFKGAIYHTRCGYSYYNWGSSPFNNSWGAHYAWNERFPLEGLLAFGVEDMPVRVMEWRRRILPFLAARAGGRGAYYHHSSTEPGMTTSERNATNFFELFHGGIIANYLYNYYRYKGDIEVLKRYYPVIREIAEFYRHWLLIELPGNNIMTVPMIDVDEGIYPVQDGPFTIAAAARLFDVVVKVADKLNEDKDILPVWQRYRDMLAHMVRHSFGEQYEKVGLYLEMNLDEMPEPAIQVDQNIMRWRDEYKKNNTPEDQFKKHKQNVGGDYSKPRNWPWGSFIRLYYDANLEQSEGTKKHLDKAFQVLLPFCGQCESAEEDFSRIDHPWFTTASGALLRGLSRVFLKPIEGGAILFGGVPDDWRDFSFELPAYHKTFIVVEVADGKIKKLLIRNEGQRVEKFCLQLPVKFITSPEVLQKLPVYISSRIAASKLYIDLKLEKGINTII